MHTPESNPAGPGPARTPTGRMGPAALPAAMLCAAAFTGVAPVIAAERAVHGEARFDPPAAATLAALPQGSPLSAADLASGRLSFEIVYDDAARDTDPDRYAGVYPDAIRAYRVRIGSAVLELPAATAALRVSDGGFGKAHRESIELLAGAWHGAWNLRVGWVRINQRATTEDLRGEPGSIPGDAIPDPVAMRSFQTSGAFDHVFFVRLDAAGGDLRRPVLYLSTSTLTVAPATAARR